jgi:hypothetical protein
LYEISRRREPVETENRLMLSWKGGEEREKGPTINRHEKLTDNVLKLMYGNDCTT